MSDGSTRLRSLRSSLNRIIWRSRDSCRFHRVASAAPSPAAADRMSSESSGYGDMGPSRKDMVVGPKIGQEIANFVRTSADAHPQSCAEQPDLPSPDEEA